MTDDLAVDEPTVDDSEDHDPTVDDFAGDDPTGDEPKDDDSEDRDPRDHDPWEHDPRDHDPRDPDPRDHDPVGGEPHRVGPWLRRSRLVAYENPWIVLYHDEVTRPDGSPGIYGVVHFRNAAVGVVALDEQDRVALVGQHRYTLDSLSWEIPEGGVPAGEGPLEGARRELREEAGVEADRWHVLARTHISNSVTDEAATLYLATGLHPVPQALESSEADLTVDWVAFSSALAMVLDGRITDAMSVIALQRLALERSKVGR